MRRKIGSILAATWLVAGLPAAGPAQGGEEKVEAKGAPTLKPKVKMETSLGDVVLELDGEKAPISVLNFLRYAKDGFYNGTIFHRVIPGFMIQGGGFTSDMEKKEKGLRPPIKNEWRNGLKNVKGSLAMARLGGNADSATAQFFINDKDNGFLDQPQPDGAAYAVFGKVVGGMDVVEKIRDTKLIKHPKYPSRDAVTPETPVVIKTVTSLDTFDSAAAQAKSDAAAAEAKAAAAKREASKGAELAEYIKAFEAKTGKKFQKTASGLMYLVLKEGTGASPKPSDTVLAHYRGTLLNGKEFGSSYKDNKPIPFALRGVIPGWTEGVGMMKVGGKRQLICPPHLAYKAAGRPPTIPPNSTLAFEVELLEIK